MPDCPFHLEIERKLAEHGAKIDINKEQVETLFEYRDHLQEIQESMKLSFMELKQNQHQWAAKLSLQLDKIAQTIDEYRSEMEGIINRVTGIEKKDENFKWFSGPMNKLQDRLPWFITAFLMLALTSWILSVTGFSKIGEWLKGAYSIFK